MPELTWLNFWSAIIFILTVWIMRSRFTKPADWNFALLYYASLVLYARGFEGELNNNIIFAGIVCALFIRFEFLGKMVLRAFRAIEFPVHCYVLVATFGTLFFRR